MNRTAKLYLLALVVAIFAQQVVLLPLLLVAGPALRAMFPWGLLIVYLVTVLLIKYLLEKTAIFPDKGTQPDSPADPRAVRRGRLLRQYALAALLALVLSAVLRPWLTMLLMAVELDALGSTAGKAVMLLFHAGMFIALTMLCKYAIERQQERADVAARCATPAACWQESALCMPGSAPAAPAAVDEELQRIIRNSWRLAVLFPAVFIVVLIYVEITAGSRGWFTSAVFLSIAGAFFALLLFPGFKAILGRHRITVPPRQMLQPLGYAHFVLYLICAACPWLWTPSLLAVMLFALGFWLLLFRGTLLCRVWWRRGAFVAAAVTAIGLLYRIAPGMTESDFSRLDCITAYAVSVVAAGLVLCVVMHRHLARAERICYLLFVLLIAGGLLRMSQLPFLLNTYNLAGYAAAAGTTERAGTEVQLLGHFRGREWPIARTVTDSQGQYCFMDARLYVTLNEGRQAIAHDYRMCMSGVRVRFARDGYDPYVMSAELNSGGAPVITGGIAFTRLADVQLQLRGTQSGQASASGNRAYQEYRGLSGYADDRSHWERMRRDRSVPRDEVEARIIACRFAETENTMFLDSESHEQAYRRVIGDAEAWRAACPESPHQATVLFALAGAQYRCGEEEGYRETAAMLRQHYPAADWQRQLAALEERP